MSGSGRVMDALWTYRRDVVTPFVGLIQFAVEFVRFALERLAVVADCGLLFGHSLQEGFEGYNGGKYQTPPLSLFLKAFKTAAMLIICAAWSSFA